MHCIIYSTTIIKHNALYRVIKKSPCTWWLKYNHQVQRLFDHPVHCSSTTIIKHDAFFFPVALQPNAGYGLLILEVSRSHTTHHNRWDSSGRVISSLQRPLPDNTQHSQQTSMPPVGFEPTTSAGERPQTYALDRTATGTGKHDALHHINIEQSSNISISYNFHDWFVNIVNLYHHKTWDFKNANTIRLVIKF